MEEDENKFNCKHETELNLQFLFECLDRTKIPYVFNHGVLTLLKDAPVEERWIESINFDYRGRGGYLWFQPGQESPKVRN